MSFYDVLEKIKDQPIERMLDNVQHQDVERVLQKNRITEEDYFMLLSLAAEDYLEDMAQKAHQLTVKNFGNTMQLFLPLYVSDYCVNTCKYCSFSVDNVFPRRILTMEEVEKEAKAISEMGIEHIIILSGESMMHSSVKYLKQCLKVLTKYFSSIGLEIQPLDTDQYQELVDSGIDGLTVYQEVYDEEIYRELHTKGPKRFFKYRLDTPERGCEAGMRSVSIAALLGLNDWRRESYITGLHAQYLQDKYLDVEVGVAFPRIRPNAGSFQPKVNVTDKNLVQAMLAYRIFQPRSGITVSTREAPEFRDQLIPLGTTKMSAASSTVVGGYTEPDNTQSQFEISDERSVDDIRSLLQSHGYQPVMKDWQIV
ncbi:2-iminoacetate synthase ThiH [Tenuibacillus multivorans]|uniref:2-iminoacetate synthase n=1 Tax=Tenuibacillus multivorans TaxID=237069 RepID=A0A1H0DZF8_9BACI|nr:2-iminoacetate synthase ThiH [Tenuibacillus multivorans]GEL76721.1 thiamine biosynthesis protein ThiH [Tenuibacillus multivorans]SDN75371.1 2-iminoacetate synthase [Tenuibacillus multivorans]